MQIDAGLGSFCAVVLAGGRAARLGGADKASVEVDGRTLLAHALDAVIDAAEVVVVGEHVPTDRPVTFILEDPRYGGPAAALLTGRDALLRDHHPGGGAGRGHAPPDADDVSSSARGGGRA